MLGFFRPLRYVGPDPQGHAGGNGVDSGAGWRARCWLRAQIRFAHAIAVWLGTCCGDRCWGLHRAGLRCHRRCSCAVGGRRIRPFCSSSSSIVALACRAAAPLPRVRGWGAGRSGFLFVVGAGLAVLVVGCGDRAVLLSLDPARATGIALLMVALVYLPGAAGGGVAAAGPGRRGAIRRSCSARLPEWRWSRPRKREQRRGVSCCARLSARSNCPKRARRAIPCAPRRRRRLCAAGARPGGISLAAAARPRSWAAAVSPPADAALAGELVGLVTALGEARSAYDRGVRHRACADCAGHPRQYRRAPCSPRSTPPPPRARTS